MRRLENQKLLDAVRQLVRERIYPFADRTGTRRYHTISSFQSVYILKIQFTRFPCRLFSSNGNLTE
jgi:hypothetical protein